MCSWERWIISQWQAFQLYCSRTSPYLSYERLLTPAEIPVLLPDYNPLIFLVSETLLTQEFQNLRVGNYVDLLKLPYWYWISRVLTPCILHVIVKK